MISLADEASVDAFLRRSRFLDAGEPIDLRRFPGGVSNHVWRVGLPARGAAVVVKQPLERLATAEEWISDTRRLNVEVAAMRALAEWVPDNVPAVLLHDPDERVVVMACAPDTSVSWKTQMMSGTFNVDTARAVGTLLAAIHDRSRRDRDTVQPAFDDLLFFDELRIDPFHRFVAGKHPDLREPIEYLIHELTEHRTAFTHGDYSPKNILVSPDGDLILIDFEVAHWGNPIFDVAYCLGHLMLKGWALDRADDALASIRAYLDGYGKIPARPSDEGQLLMRHLGLMLLARIDGKSTVDYLTDPDLVGRIRSVARSWISSDNDEFEPIRQMTRALALTGRKRA